MQKEIWKDVIGYEGLYQVSNFGNIKSLPRKKNSRNNSFYYTKEKLLKLYNNNGYLKVSIHKDSKMKLIKVHQLVVMAFLNHIPDGTQRLVVDHINDNKLDNRLENLQVVTQRYNAFKTQGKYSSKYKGVNWCKTHNKWISRIVLNKKRIYLGSFSCEISAHLAYKNKLKEIIE